MNNLIIIIILFVFSPIINFGQVNLTVEIAPLRTNNGQVLLELNDENEEILQGFSGKIVDNKCIIILENLKNLRTKLLIGWLENVKKLQKIFEVNLKWVC